MLGLCLAGALAVIALVASSAMAGKPEWGQCYAKKGGKYANSNCATKAKKGKGEYEWRKGTAVTGNRSFRGVGGKSLLKAAYASCYLTLRNPISTKLTKE